MSSTRFTIKTFAELNGISHEAATAMIQYLRHVGVVTNAGTMPKEEGKKGRSENIYAGQSEKIRNHLDSLKFG